MCLIPTYTEVEKRNQITKVQSLLNLPINTEQDRKNLLYNLSLMNSMVVKGYKKERTDADGEIYTLKNKVLNMLPELMPGRCFMADDVLYVYAAGRQYSYHVKYFIQGALYNNRVKWDGIKEGFALSDEEYKSKHNEFVEFDRHVNQREQENEAKEEKDMNRKVRIYLLRGIKEARRLNDEIRKHNDYFWKVIENGLTKAQKRTMAYKNRDGYKLRRLYGEELGLTWEDEPNRLEDWPVMTWGRGRYDYQKSDEGNQIWQRMIELYQEIEKKNIKKYII